MDLLANELGIVGILYQNLVRRLGGGRMSMRDLCCSKKTESRFRGIASYQVLIKDTRKINMQ